MRRWMVRAWRLGSGLAVLLLFAALSPGAASGQDDSVDVTITEGDTPDAQTGAVRDAPDPNVADGTAAATPPTSRGGTAAGENSGTVAQPSSAAAGNAAAGTRSGPGAGR